jgi:elongation factor P
MVAARDFKKGMVITLDGAHWVVEDYHSQKAAQRHPVLHVKLRNMKTRHVVERSFDEADQVQQPELHTKSHQYLYHDKSGFVFMDSETFEQVAVPDELVGNGKWLLKESAEFLIRFLDGAVVEVVFPPNFMDEVVETAEPSSGAHSSNVWKDATLTCGLVVKVPMFIKVGEHVKVDTATHKYLGKEGVPR